MTKTISLTLENPITMLGRKLAKRKISKLSKQIEKRQEKIAKLNSKYFKNDSTQKTTVKEVSEPLTEKQYAKMKTLDNKIIAKTNNRNSNLHLDKGRIDEVIEMLKQTPTKDLVISTKAGKTRVFINSPNPLKISRVKKFLKNHGGYEMIVQ